MYSGGIGLLRPGVAFTGCTMYQKWQDWYHFTYCCFKYLGDFPLQAKYLTPDYKPNLSTFKAISTVIIHH
jgi:hypothetical protein